MILNLPRESCGCCKKSIYFGQSVLECDNCNIIIHGKCYKNSNFVNKDSLWLCEVCNSAHEPRYNPFKPIHVSNPDSEAFYDEDPCDYIDTFKIMSNLLDNCRSYSKKELNEINAKIKEPENASLFSSYFLNVDGNASNFDELSIELKQLEHQYSVLGLAETNIDQSHKDLYQLQNYKSFYQSKSNEKKKGTGVAIYVHDSFNATLIGEYCIVNENIESLFITITNTHEPIIVGCIYRPPNGDLSSFIQQLSNIVNELPRTPVYLLGDYNIDLLSITGDLANEYEQLLVTSNFMPLVSTYTHHKPGCKKTCIDNIITNNYENVVTSGTVSESISHHLPIFQVSFVAKSTLSKGAQKHTQYYDFSNSNMNNFADQLLGSLQEIEPNETNFGLFHSTFKNIMDKTCKLEKPKVSKRNNLTNPWITDSLEYAINKKHKLHSEWKRTVSKRSPGGSVEKRQKFVVYRNIVKKCIKHAKEKFYANKFVECKGNGKKTWQLINQVRGKSKQSIKPMFVIENEKISNRRMIADAFNKYFTSIAEEMNDKSPDSKPKGNDAEQPSFLDFLKTSCASSMYLYDCTSDEVQQIINDLENGKASDIPIKLVKRSSQILGPKLSQYYNILMQKGIFPNELKVGKITPIYKKGNEEKLENYRPVSTLPLFGKIFEKIIYKRLYSFLIYQGILNETQFGFRKGHSTSHALNFSTNEIRKSWAKGEHVIGIFIDLSKAFDTISHSKLLTKLERYGIRGSALSLLTSYLADRTQYTNVLGENSDRLPVKYGVPQGSVLGPLLFLIYINDILNCSKLGVFVLFADDTNIFIKGNNLSDALLKANDVLQSIDLYMKLNELHINMTKSCFMHFDPHPRTNKSDDVDILLKINDIPIKRVEYTRFLGVIIDRKLSWKEHVMALKNKLKCQAGAINRIKECVPKDLYRDLYYTLFHSHLSYCIDVWGGVSSNMLNQLFVVQKLCVRILFGDKETYFDKFKTCARCRPLCEQRLGYSFYRKEHSKPLFVKHDIMAVRNLYSYRCIMEVFKILKFRVPISLFSEFAFSERTFKNTFLITPPPSNDFMYKSSVLWNVMRKKFDIADDFSVSINYFKNSLKSLMLSNQNTFDSDEWTDQNFKT